MVNITDLLFSYFLDLMMPWITEKRPAKHQ